MTVASLLGRTGEVRLGDAADWLAVAAAVSLPWSTTASGVLFALLALALAARLDASALRRELATAAGGLPVLLALLGVLGMTWADVGWDERWAGATSFFKLMLIPLLFAHFRRSARGSWVLAGYLASCVVLLVLSSVIHDPEKVDAVLVKNAATQSGEFVTCIFALLPFARDCLARRQWRRLAVIAAAVLGMLANMVYVATGRTAILVALVLLVLFAARQLGRREALALFCGAAAIAAAAWFSSPYLRQRTIELWNGYEAYEEANALTSSGERMAFYRKSLLFIRAAPLFGHGTGSIGALFDAAARGKTGSEGSRSNNPHNQTFAVAIQVGLAGAAVLWLMWLAHLALFRGPGRLEWIGLVVVVQNVVGSLFNSHLFDFVQGWVYVLGVGVVGGMILGRRRGEPEEGA